MANLISAGDAKLLDLPGRKSSEILPGRTGAQSSVRLVEIPVPEPGAPPRQPHWHPDTEEVIHVLSGEGITRAGGRDYPMHPGDTIRVPPMEKHVTRNVGDTPLVLLCFFPVPEITIRTDEAEEK